MHFGRGYSGERRKEGKQGQERRGKVLTAENVTHHWATFRFPSKAHPSHEPVKTPSMAAEAGKPLCEYAADSEAPFEDAATLVCQPTHRQIS